jgi:hypothetical protein
MHGTTSALVGVSLGRFRFGHGRTRTAALALGWAAAMALHMTFNQITKQADEALPLASLWGIGLAGVLLVWLFIRWGLAEERDWLRDSLQLDVGVSQSESNVIQQMADVNRVLKPVEERFGRRKRQQVEVFLKRQAQLGLRRRVAEQARDAAQRETAARQVQEMVAEVDAARRDVGVYCMAFVRMLLPPENDEIWARLALQVRDAPTSGTNVWATLAQRSGPPAAPDQAPGPAEPQTTMGS